MRAYRAPGAKMFMDSHFFIFHIHGRAGQFVQTNLVVLAFLLIDIKGLGAFQLAGGSGKQGTHLLRNNDRYAVIFSRRFNFFYGTFNPEWPDQMHIFNTTPSDDLLDGNACARDAQAQRLGVHTGVDLVSGHRRRTVVQDDQREFVIVVDAIDQAGDAGPVG